MEAMEGLIPFIYKAVKERRTRSYYSRCNSTGSSRGRFLGARVEDSSWDQQKQWDRSAGGKATTAAEREMVAHRRHRSLEELAGEVGASPEWRRRLGALPRGRSVRIFSCIRGM
ncbi:uncharacterized protein LOC8062454 [Sorghum bicolor]|jgi:hypothetical protein|uniref:Uncharacterized protein n=1 Tax=Sorghum bicolor TaxID=4558 RepID=A0A1W0W0V5_SORBI|nr:uncharacterized protein LOC8062454 [Sorghum bicolor]OQU88008.1 hypothetical protein SORBI_3003G382800 [Sorghum bicolor]|eukprot:XP_002458892.1 uncharacterized protein LOC8062454 [Sorghum bicolor]